MHVKHLTTSIGICVTVLFISKDMVKNKIKDMDTSSSSWLSKTKTAAFSGLYSLIIKPFINSGFCDTLKMF